MYKNFPNYLTIARIFAIPMIVVSFYFGDSKFAHRFGACLFAFASITDFFDGYFARKFNLISQFGRIFDPIADKLLVGSVIVMLVKYNRADEIPCLLILGREFAVAGLREFLAQIKLSVPVTQFSKMKTIMQMLSFTLLILGSVGSGIASLDKIAHIILWITAILTVFTGTSYLKITGKCF